MNHDDSYIAARAIQFFTPGIPQVYTSGCWQVCNDEELMKRHRRAERYKTGNFYSLEEDGRGHWSSPWVQRLLKLMRFRSNYPAFEWPLRAQTIRTTPAWPWPGAWRPIIAICWWISTSRPPEISYLDEEDFSENSLPVRPWVNSKTTWEMIDESSCCK